MSSRPFLSVLPFVVTSVTTVLAAPVPFESTPGFDLQLSDPEKILERLSGAVASLQRGDTGRAASEAQAVLREDPGSAIAYEVLGAVAMSKQDWIGAERALNEAVRLSPQSSTAVTRLGSTLLAMNRGPEAEQMFRKALAISPDRSSARRNLAVLALREGRLSQALAELQEGIEISRGTDRVGKYFMATLYLEMRQPADAERLATELVNDERAWPPAAILLAIVKLDQAKLNSSLPLLESAVPNVPKWAWSRLSAGVTLRSKGNLAESRRLLEQVTQDRPDWMLAHFELGETLSALRQFDLARQAYARAKHVALTSDPYLSFLAGVAETYAWQAQRSSGVAPSRLKAAR